MFSIIMSINTEFENITFMKNPNLESLLNDVLLILRKICFTELVEDEFVKRDLRNNNPNIREIKTYSRQSKGSSAVQKKPTDDNLTMEEPERKYILSNEFVSVIHYHPLYD